MNDNEIHITIYSNHANILVITCCFVSSKEKGKFVPQLRSAFSCSALVKLDLFGDFRTIVIRCY